jgi:hypothetical protein
MIRGTIAAVATTIVVFFFFFFDDVGRSLGRSLSVSILRAHVTLRAHL